MRYILTNILRIGRNGRRGTWNNNKRNSSGSTSVCDGDPHQGEKPICSVSTHHEGDLLAGLRLPANHQDAGAEDEETHGQQHQDPHLHSQDGADVVGGEVADHTHHQHWDMQSHNKQSTHTSNHRRETNKDLQSCLST